MDETNINYLLSAMVQSGAALVAIVGGLLGARYVSLHVEKAAARRDLAAVLQRKDDADERLRIVQSELMDNRARQFLCREAVWSTVLEPDLDTDHLVAEAEAEAERRYETSSADRVIRQVRRQAAIARSRFSDFEKGTGANSEWRVIQRVHGIAVSDPDEDFVYATTLYKMRMDLAGKVTENRATEARKMLARSLPIEFERLKAREAVLVQQENDRYERDARAYDDYEAAQRHAESLREGEGFSLAIEVLGMVAALTIIVPLVAMVGDVYDYVPATRWLFVFVFIAGLFVLGLYLWVYARFLGERRATMPDHLWGLFKTSPKERPTESESQPVDE